MVGRDGRKYPLHNPHERSELGELLPISDLQQAFQFKKISLAKGETGAVGKVGGLVVIRHTWSSSKPAILIIDPFDQSVTQIAGRSYEQIPLEITWDGSGYGATMKITSTYNSTTPFYIAWQYLYD